MTRIKTVWLKEKAYTPTAVKLGYYILARTVVRENGIWCGAKFCWNDQNFRWERFQ